MTTNRRHFIKQVGGASAVCLLPGASSLVLANDEAEPRSRQSLAEFSQDETKVASLRKAIRTMRELEPTNPFSWIFQSNIHGRPTFPDYMLEAANSAGAPPELRLFGDDPDFTPDEDVFEQCPHGNWFFLPWHRAYLHYFERILRWASQDPDLTLPYWDYSSQDQRTIPPAFQRPILPDGSYNPLYLPGRVAVPDGDSNLQLFPMRNMAFNFGVTQFTPGAVSLGALDLIPFVGENDGDSFGGAPSRRMETESDREILTRRTASGSLEGVPHDLVHVGVGGDGAVFGNDIRLGFMSYPPTAARDPLFWMHHCNIDRLWEVWSNLGDGRQNSDDEEWLDFEFTFYDVGDFDASDGSPVPARIKVRDVLDVQKLGYKYAPSSLPPTRQPGEFIAGRKTRVLASSRLPRTPQSRSVAQRHTDDDAGIVLTNNSSTTVSVRTLNEQSRNLLRMADSNNASQRIVLSLEGIEANATPGNYYEVYVNLPAGEVTDNQSPGYAGALTFFGLSHHGHTGSHHHPTQVRFDITDIAAKLDQTDDEDVKIELVQRSVTETVHPGIRLPNVPARTVATLRSIRILMVE